MMFFAREKSYLNRNDIIHNIVKVILYSISLVQFIFWLILLTLLERHVNMAEGRGFFNKIIKNKHSDIFIQ